MGVAARLARHAAPVLVAAFVIGLGIWRWADLDPLSTRLEGALIDIRFQFRGPEAPPAGVVVVAVDERALGEIGAYAPLRAAMARALPLIAADRPQAIGIDMLLVDKTDAGADAALATALRQSAPVLLGAATTESRVDSFDGTTAPEYAPDQEAALTRSAIPVVIGASASDLRAAPSLLLPTPVLAAEALMAHVNVTAGTDTAVRALPAAIPAGGGRMLPSMAMAAAHFALVDGDGQFSCRLGVSCRIGERTVPLNRKGRMVIQHYGPAGTIPTVGLLDVLGGSRPPGAFADKLVFVGSTAPSLRDAFATPFGHAVPGVEVLATAAGNILEGRHLGRDATTAALSVLLGLAAGFAALAAFGIRRMALALAAAVGAFAATAVALQFAFTDARLWLDGVTVLGGFAAGTAAGGWTRLGREQRHSTNLAHYVSPTLVRQLSEDSRPSFDGREQEVGLLFVDVASYSTMVENRPPAEVAVFLRDLHELFADAAEDHGGVVVDYQGDGALMVFGLPEATSVDAANALAGAEALMAGRGRVKADFLTGPIRLRISVHFGPVACAVLGGSRHAVISVTGDAVNVTARLQEFAKEHGEMLVATRAVLDAAGNPPGFRLVGTEALRGRKAEIEVWGGAAA